MFQSHFLAISSYHHILDMVEQHSRTHEILKFKNLLTTHPPKFFETCRRYGVLDVFVFCLKSLDKTYIFYKQYSKCGTGWCYSACYILIHHANVVASPISYRVFCDNSTDAQVTRYKTPCILLLVRICKIFFGLFLWAMYLVVIFFFSCRNCRI